MNDPDEWTRPEPLYPLVVAMLDTLVRMCCALRTAGRRLPSAGPVVVAANHVHRLDAVVFTVVARRHGRRLRFLALADLWQVPVLGWMLRTGRMIPVYRGHGPSRMVDDACRALEADQAILVYPEGRLARDDLDASAQPGAGLLALVSNAPVVPMALWGLGPLQPSVRRVRRPIGVAIGSPVDLSAWAGRTDAEAAHEAATAVLSAVQGLLPIAARLAGHPA